MAFCDRIKEARSIAGLTQLQLAEILGVAKSTVSSYENGDRDPPPNMILKLINALGVDANYLFQDEANNINSEAVHAPDEKPLLKKYRKLDTHGKRIVNIVLDEEYSRCSAEEESKVVEFVFDNVSGEYVARSKTGITQDMAEKMVEKLKRIGEE